MLESFYTLLFSLFCFGYCVIEPPLEYTWTLTGDVVKLALEMWKGFGCKMIVDI